MDPNYYGLVELLLVFGSVIGIAVWQLVVLERDKKAAKKTPVVPQPGQQDERQH